MTLVETVTIPIELTNGNDGRGFQYHASASRRRKYGEILFLMFAGRKPFDHPVSLVVTRIIRKGCRRWDADSVLRGSAKELIDAMVSAGFFHDDSPKWITTCDGRQRKDPTSGPASVVDIFRSE